MPSSKAKKPEKSRSRKKQTRSAKSAKSTSARSKSTKAAKATRASSSHGESHGESNGRKRKRTASAPKVAGDGQAENGRQRNVPARRVTQDAEGRKDKRQLVQERKLLRSQSRWLQKALFALAKAEGDQEKLAEVRGETHEPMAVTIDATTHELGEVTDSLRDAVMARLESMRVTLRNEHALMG